MGTLTLPKRLLGLLEIRKDFKTGHMGPWDSYAKEEGGLPGADAMLSLFAAQYCKIAMA